MKAKRSHFHYISPYNSIPCCLADNDALKICNFAKICCKMPFACYHGITSYLTWCFVWNRSRFCVPVHSKSSKYFRCFSGFYMPKEHTRLFCGVSNMPFKNEGSVGINCKGSPIIQRSVLTEKHWWAKTTKAYKIYKAHKIYKNVIALQRYVKSIKGYKNHDSIQNPR